MPCLRIPLNASFVWTDQDTLPSEGGLGHVEPTWATRRLDGLKAEKGHEGLLRESALFTTTVGGSVVVLSPIILPFR